MARRVRGGFAVPTDPGDVVWFEKLFGFQEKTGETGAAETAATFSYDGVNLTCPNGRSFQAGRLLTPSLQELRNLVRESPTSHLCGVTGEIKVERISVDDVSDLHVDCSNSGALFQAASQFNGLEFPSPEVTPERGITDYVQDVTQGPSCAVACAPGAVIRNYFAFSDGGRCQTRDRQINNLEDALRLLGPSGMEFVNIKNGYALSTNDQLKDLNKKLADLTLVEEVKKRLRISLQQDTQVTSSKRGSNMYEGPLIRVTQAFCAAAAVADSDCAPALWAPMAQLILEASYEMTLLAAVLNARRHPDVPAARKVFLTDLGGGAFGNEMQWIVDARQRAIDKFKDVPLQVYVISKAGLRLRTEPGGWTRLEFQEPPATVKDKSTRECPIYFKGLRLVMALLDPTINPGYYFGKEHALDYCYCENCMANRKDSEEYTRGGEPYFLPKDFVGIALPLNSSWATEMEVFNPKTGGTRSKVWKNAFHPVLHPEAIPHFVETMSILQQGDTGPFAEPHHISRGQKACSGSGEIHFLRSVRFTEAAAQGYGPAYQGLQLALQCRLAPGSFEHACDQPEAPLQKLITKRRLAHVITRILVRPPADDNDFAKLLKQWNEVGLTFAGTKKEMIRLAQEERKDIIFASKNPFPWSHHGPGLRFAPAGSDRDSKEVQACKLIQDVQEPPPRSGCTCFERAERFVKSLGLGVLLNGKQLCWCTECVTAVQPGMPDFSKGGSPERRFEVPKGWCEFGIHPPVTGCRADTILREWQPAYHAAKAGPELIANIIQRGSALLKAGDHTFDGVELNVQPGHIKNAKDRDNEYSKQRELFDPTGKFFMSPTWGYIANKVYMSTMTFENVPMQAMLKLRVRPYSFAIGQTTTPTAKYSKDPQWSDRLEYYSNQFGSHMIESILVREGAL